MGGVRSVVALDLMRRCTAFDTLITSVVLSVAHSPKLVIFGTAGQRPRPVLPR